MMRTRLGLLLGVLVLSSVTTGIAAAPALALSPSVATLAASSIEQTSAILRGEVNPNGSETKAYFEYGTTTSYGTKTTEVNVGSGTSTLEHTQSIGGLKPNTVYHYRIAATNAFGTSQGLDKTFTTLKPLSGATYPPETYLELGTEFRAANESDFRLVPIGGGFVPKCEESEFEGEVVEGKEGVAMKGSLSSLVLQSCGSSTVSVITPGSIEVHATAGGNGTLTSTGLEITVLTHVFGITSHCRYHTENSDLGTFKGSSTTGGTATLELREHGIPKGETAESGTFCSAEVEVETDYTFTAPDYLDVD
jgi:hypothetical protein